MNMKEALELVVDLNEHNTLLTGEQLRLFRLILQNAEDTPENNCWKASCLSL